MPGKKKQVTCLADLMEYEVDEFSDMLDEGLFDNFDDDDGDSDISKDWKRALKDLEELGYMEDDKQSCHFLLRKSKNFCIIIIQKGR